MPNNHFNISEERSMAGKAITETYKGILRVANNINLVEGENDEFLSPVYYANNKFASQNGLNETKPFLSGEDTSKRFAGADSYTSLKLPVTDSMGNFLNFALGTSSSYIGSNEEAGKIINGKVQFTDDDTETFAVVKPNDTVRVGLSERLKLSEKTIQSGKLSIGKNGKLVIKNNFRHNVNSIVPVGSNENVRTIVSMSEEPTYLDAFIYRQENYHKNGQNTDCFVNVENLKQYVDKKLEYYLYHNKTEVPSGTIISQYCSLDKWFCLDENNNVDDTDLWEGYRPAMYAIGKTSYASENVVQNQAVRRSSYLYLNDAPTGELPPDFKRGYALCDGSSLSLKLCPSYILASESSQDSIKYFFNLFHFIGYYYNKKEFLPTIKRVQKVGTNYRFYETGDDLPDLKSYTFRNINTECAYANTMAAVLIFKAIEKEFVKNRLKYTSPEAVINWLATCEIPDEYVFNVIMPTELATKAENNYFGYSNPNTADRINVNIGREINHFSNAIPYYIYNKNNGSYSLELVPIFKTAEAYYFAKLFVERAGFEKWEPFSYTFQLPTLFTTTDSSANMALTKKEGGDMANSAIFAIGNFIGSNGIVIGDKLELSNGESKTVDLTQTALTYKSHYIMAEGYKPHTHGIAKGRDILPLTSDYFNPSGTDEPDINQTYIKEEGLKANYTNERISLDALMSEVDAPAADYKSSPVKPASLAELSADPQLNYILQPVQEATAVTVYNTINGLPPAREYYITKPDESDPDKPNIIDTDYVWYGRTSDAIWAETPNSSSSAKFNLSLGYFRPESVKVLPLIKL